MSNDVLDLPWCREWDGQRYLVPDSRARLTHRDRRRRQLSRWLYFNAGKTKWLTCRVRTLAGEILHLMKETEGDYALWIPAKGGGCALHWKMLHDWTHAATRQSEMLHVCPEDGTCHPVSHWTTPKYQVFINSVNRQIDRSFLLRLFFSALPLPSLIDVLPHLLSTSFCYLSIWCVQ